jgi:hypothetical protein
MNESSVGAASGLLPTNSHRYPAGSAPPKTCSGHALLPATAGAMPSTLNFARDCYTQDVQEPLAVLVVDDDPLIIDTLAAGLPYYGFSTLTALSAAEARDLMASGTISESSFPTSTCQRKAASRLRKSCCAIGLRRTRSKSF